jgi:hypothetical protein
MFFTMLQALLERECWMLWLIMGQLMASQWDRHLE